MSDKDKNMSTNDNAPEETTAVTDTDPIPTSANPWFKNWKVVAPAAAAVIALAVGVVAVAAPSGAKEPTEADLAAIAAITDSVNAVTKASDNCIATVGVADDKLTAGTEDATTTVTGIYGADSQEADAIASILSVLEPTDAGDCDATAVTLAEGASPTDEVDRIVAANEDIVTAIQMVGSAAMSTGSEAEITAVNLLGVKTTVDEQEAANKSLKDATKAATDLEGSDLWAGVTKDQRSELADLVTAADDAAAMKVDGLDADTIQARNDAVDAAATAVADKVADLTKAAQKVVDEQAAKPTPERSTPGSSGTQSSGSSSGDENTSPGTTNTPEPEETADPVPEPEETADPVPEPEETADPVPEPEPADPCDNGSCITVGQVKSAIAQYQGGGSNCGPVAGYGGLTGDSLGGLTGWVRQTEATSPGDWKFAVSAAGTGGAGKPMVKVTAKVCS